MRCRRCNRHLTSEPGRSQGIGPICAKKEANRDIMDQSESDNDQIVPYDGGDIFIRRISNTRIGPGGQMSIGFDTCSDIVTNVPRRIYDHSPTGYNFGYGGSGPADFAFNVMLMFLGKEDAQSIYQEFKRKFVACGEDKPELRIPRQTIIDFIKANGKNPIV
jgi:hypothetical protein